jgi:hypothetical protein
MFSAWKRILAQTGPEGAQTGEADQPDLRVLETATGESAVQAETESLSDEATGAPSADDTPATGSAQADKHTISLPFEAISGTWPAELRSALGDDVNRDSWFHLPLHLIEPGLRRGCVALRWRELAALASPPVSSRSFDSVADTVVEVPLEQLVSLYLLQSGLFGEDTPNRLPDDVPDLFFSGPPSARSASARFAESAPDSAASESRDVSRSVDQSRTELAECVRHSEEIAKATPAEEHEKPGAPRTEPCSTAVLALPLALLLPCWPRPVRRALEGIRLESHQVRFPVEQVKARMRRGRVQFVWSEVQSWIVPAFGGVTTKLPGSLKIRVPLELLDEPYREWQRANAITDSAAPPASGSQAAIEEGRGAEARREGTSPSQSPEGASDEVCAWPKWPNHPLEPEELVATLRAVPAVEAIYVTDEEGRIVTGAAPFATTTELMQVLVPELRRRLLDSWKAFEMGDSRWLLLAGKERTLVFWSVRDRCVIAVTRTSDRPSVEFFRFIAEAPATAA